MEGGAAGFFIELALPFFLFAGEALQVEEDSEGAVEFGDGDIVDEGFEDALLDEEGGGFGQGDAVVGVGILDGVNELLEELAFLGEGAAILVEAAEGAGVCLNAEAAVFDRSGEEFDDAVIGIVLAEVEDVLLVGRWEGVEFADFFHGSDGCDLHTWHAATQADGMSAGKLRGACACVSLIFFLEGRSQLGGAARFTERA